MLGMVSLEVGGGIDFACWGWPVCKLEGVLTLHVGDGQFASWSNSEEACSDHDVS